MTRSVRAATARTNLPYTMTGVEYIAPGAAVIGISKNGARFYGSTGNILKMCLDLATAATPTWTNVHDFTAEGGANHTVGGIHEMFNGEVLVPCTNGSGFSALYASSGWAANPATATWTKVLTATNGVFSPQYSLSDFCSGTNGVVYLIDSNSAQTLGGEANAATDATRGGFGMLSTDFGKTWTKVFDLVAYATSRGFPYAAGLHTHGSCYDEVDDRIYQIYGDNTGQGKDVAGLGYSQVVYSDDRGATWNRLPNPSKFDTTAPGSATTIQYIGVAPLETCVLFSPDVNQPAAAVMYPRAGYRQLGVAHISTTIYYGGVNGYIQRTGVGIDKPVFVGGTVVQTQTGSRKVQIPMLHPGQSAWSRLDYDIPVQSPNITGYGFGRVFGPFANGRIVATCRHSVGGSGNTLMRATLVNPT